MLRILLLALVASFATPALAQKVLVPHAPVYKDGESFVGEYRDDTIGGRMQLHQWSKTGNDQKTYVHVNMVLGGQVLVRAIFNPLTYRMLGVNEREKTRLMETTCSDSLLYPITANKQYECTSKFDINGRVVISRGSMRFDAGTRDGQGRLTGYCAEVVDDSTDLYTRGRMCFSPDGKWIRRLLLLQMHSQDST